jgi:hypothetical protein
MSEIMRKACIAIGAFHLISWVLGALGYLDYYVCIKAPAGSCISIEPAKPKKETNHVSLFEIPLTRRGSDITG